MKTLLRNGCLAGLVGGLAFAVFMLAFARGPIDEAIALEEAAGASHTHDAGDEAVHDHGAGQEQLFSRGVQEVGGAIGVLVFGVAVGAIFGVVLGATSSKLGARTVMSASVRLGLIGFWTAVVIPFLKLPANPPAVGDPDTINQRTLLYFAVLLASILLTVMVAQVTGSLGVGQIGRAWFAAAFYSIGLAVIFFVLPGNPDAIEVDGDLLWRFRLVSLGGLAVLWAVMALTMGTLMQRQRNSAAAEAEAVTPSNAAV